MRYTPQILSLAVLLGAATGAAAKPAYVASTVNLRAAPGTTSEIVAKIPGGSLIDADNCSEGWCAVTFQDKSGFAIESALDLSGRVPARRAAAPSGPSGPPVYVEEPDYVAGPPVVYYGPRRYYGGPYYYPRYYGPYRRW